MGLNSESHAKANSVSQPEVRPSLAQWWDSRLKKQPTRTFCASWAQTCACQYLIRGSCCVYCPTIKRVEGIFIKYERLDSVSCQHLVFSQFAAQLFPTLMHTQ